MSNQCGAQTTRGHPCKNDADSCPWHGEDAADTGAPLKMDNEERQKCAIDMAKTGAAVKGCARAAGVHHETFAKYLDRCDDPEKDGGDPDFLESFNRARAEGERELVEKAMMDGDAKWLLSTSFGYKKVEGVEVSGPNGEPVEHRGGMTSLLKNISTEDVEKAQELLSGREEDIDYGLPVNGDHS